MRYSHKDFSTNLLLKIKEMEHALKEPTELLLEKYKPVFTEKNLDFDIELVIEGKDHFVPEYNSFVVAGISEENELLDLYTIPIWKCERTFLGLPTLRNIPGCRIVGEFIDESIEQVLEELKEHIEETWKDHVLEDTL
ncbi:hypothetical protein [Bacillus rhizoplanae]|uniref:hypothetical protein n=1 Tax=Bacillus rhizoplanae TaxID=2880966 RepID=UPI003D23291C